MKRVIVLGATGSFGGKVIEYLNNNSEEYEIVGISLYQNLKRLDELVFNIPSISNIAIVKDNTYFEIKQRNMNFYYGYDANIQLIKHCKADFIVNCIYGSIALDPVLFALKKGIKVYNINKEIFLYDFKDLKKYKDLLIPLDPYIDTLKQLIEKGTDINQKIEFVTTGGPLKDYPIDKLFSAYNKALFKSKKDEEGNRFSLDCATSIYLYKVFIEAKFYFNIDLDNVNPTIKNDGEELIKIDNNLYGVNDNFSHPFENISTLVLLNNKEEIPFDKNRYPLLSYLFKNYKIYQEKLNISLNASNEIGIGQFLKNKISYGDLETMIRRVTSDAIKQKTETNNIVQIAYIDEYSKDLAKSIIEKTINIKESGLNKKTLKKNQKKKDKENKVDISKKKDEIRRKKMSRWRNDPTKKELLEKHKKIKEKKLKKEERNINKTSVKVSNVKENEFPVFINDVDSKHRLNDKQHSYKKKVAKK